MIQLTSDETVHAHSVGAPTVKEAAPPAAPMVIWDVANPTAHLTGVGAVEIVDDEPHAAVATATDVTSISSLFKDAPARRIAE